MSDTDKAGTTALPQESEKAQTTFTDSIPKTRQPSILLLGAPGSGKTVLACSAPGRKFLIDLDAKADEMAILRDRINSGEIKIAELTSPLLVENLLTRAMRITEKVQQEPQGYIEFVKLVNRLADEGNNYDTWIIDPLTRVGEHLSRYIAYRNNVNAMRPRDYGTYLKIMEEIIDKLRKAARARGKLLILTIHQRYLEEPSGDMRVKHSLDAKGMPSEERVGTSVVRQMPALDGQIAAKLAGYFSEAWVCRAVPASSGHVKYVVQTVPDGMTDARTSCNLPPYFEGTIVEALSGKARPA